MNIHRHFEMLLCKCVCLSTCRMATSLRSWLSCLVGKRNLSIILIATSLPVFLRFPAVYKQNTVHSIEHNCLVQIASHTLFTIIKKNNGIKVNISDASEGLCTHFLISHCIECYCYCESYVWISNDHHNYLRRQCRIAQIQELHLGISDKLCLCPIRQGNKHANMPRFIDINTYFIPVYPYILHLCVTCSENIVQLQCLN